MYVSTMRIMNLFARSQEVHIQKNKSKEASISMIHGKRQSSVLTAHRPCHVAGARWHDRAWWTEHRPRDRALVTEQTMFKSEVPFQQSSLSSGLLCWDGVGLQDATGEKQHGPGVTADVPGPLGVRPRPARRAARPVGPAPRASQPSASASAFQRPPRRPG
jgi:hypothetical protein